MTNRDKAEEWLYEADPYDIYAMDRSNPSCGIGAAYEALIKAVEAAMAGEVSDVD